MKAEKRELNAFAIADLLQLMTYIECEKDEILLEYGDVGDKFYLILEG